MGSLAGPQFPSTRWSRILAGGGRRDLDALARAYLGPVQAFLRAHLGCRQGDAADLAQEAFAWMLASGLFDKADPQRGRFRGLLKKALANFAVEQLRRDGAQKRGGGIVHRPLDAAAELVDHASPTPEQALDEAWRRELLERASEELRRELEGNGKNVHWALFRDYFLVAGEQPTHAALAGRHGITTTDVGNWLDHSKRRYRAVLRDLVADTVGDAEELEAELRWLFGTPVDRRGAR